MPGRDLPNSGAHPDTAPLARVEFGPAPSAAPAELEHWIEGEHPATFGLRSSLRAALDDNPSVVLLRGEPGSGRLRAAQWLHRASNRSSRPLVLIDAVDPGAALKLRQVIDLIRGAEALDDPRVPGHVLARNLDRADEELARALLDVLAEQGVALRCGLILMHHLDASRLRQRGVALERLLGRAGAASIHVPPLRERASDIPILARSLSTLHARRHGRELKGISPQALTRLQRHPFPGNVHELSLAIELAIVRSAGDWLTLESFPGIATGEPTPAEPGEITIRLPGSSLREIELQALKLALQLTGGRVVRAAELLGVTRHALRRKLDKYGLGDLRQRASGPARPPAPAPGEDEYI